MISYTTVKANDVNGVIRLVNEQNQYKVENFRIVSLTNEPSGDVTALVEVTPRIELVPVRQEETAPVKMKTVKELLSDLIMLSKGESLSEETLVALLSFTLEKLKENDGSVVISLNGSHAVITIPPTELTSSIHVKW